jgi:hypothetical protein
VDTPGLAFWASLDVSRVTVKGAHRRGGYLQIIQKPNAGAEIDIAARSNAGENSSAACHKLHYLLHVNARGAIIPCPQEIHDKNILGHTDDIANVREMLRVTRSHVPNFDICEGCELKPQDLIDYHARFFAEQFPERLESWKTRLAMYQSAVA